MQIHSPTAFRPARDAASYVIVADNQAGDVDALELLPVGRERERKLAVKPGGLHLDFTQPRNLLIRKIENQLAHARNIAGFVPSGFRNQQAGCAKVEQRLNLGAPCIKSRIGQIDTDRSADPVGQIVEIKPTPLGVVELQHDAVSAAHTILDFEGDAAVEAYRDAIETRFSLEADARSAEVDSKISVTQIATHRGFGD